MGRFNIHNNNMFRQNRWQYHPLHTISGNIITFKFKKGHIPPRNSKMWLFSSFNEQTKGRSAHELTFSIKITIFTTKFMLQGPKHM
jgi:hypothetical protein